MRRHHIINTQEQIKQYDNKMIRKLINFFLLLSVLVFLYFPEITCDTSQSTLGGTMTSGAQSNFGCDMIAYKVNGNTQVGAN